LKSCSAWKGLEIAGKEQSLERLFLDGMAAKLF
jgi:hypothetical protein